LLTQRLALLERTGLVERQPHPNGRGTRYSLTDAGRSLADVGVALGEWGARWLEIAPQHLDPYVVLWAMCGSVRWDLVPDRRIVVRLRFPDERKWRSVFWLLYERGRAEVCLRHPGGEDDLSITAESEYFVRWHMGRPAWRGAVGDKRITVEGRRELARAF